MASNFPPLRPPPRPHSPSGHRSQSSFSGRSESSLSTESTDSVQMPTLAVNKPRSPYQQQGAPARPSTSSGPGPSQSTSSLQNFSRPRAGMRTSVDGTIRTASPNMPQGSHFGHRARQHSQGFFEPSLSHATANPAGLSASQIAAQAAMHHVSPPVGQVKDDRKRSYPGLAPINTGQQASFRRPSDNNSPQVGSASGLPYSNGSLGGSRLIATTAANVAFPSGRSPIPSPGILSTPQVQPHYAQSSPQPPASNVMGPPPEKEPKTKSSKMKLFSKPKNITLSKDKEGRATPAMPSPGKSTIGQHVLRSGFASVSTTSLIETASSGASSIYSSANASTSTLVPVSTGEKEKEKQRHHFLSRQKNKLKDEHNALPLSSAHSNSQATNPDRPQPLYSFTPDSPGATPFSKSVSGFDLRHGGKALREKRKEEKAAAKLDLQQIPSNVSATTGQSSDAFMGPSSHDPSFGPPTGGTGSVFNFTGDQTPAVNAQAFSNIGASMGLPGIGPDDAWPLLKARLLNLFSGEDLRTPIEDFNLLVSVHIRRCIQRHSPIVLVEDLRELLQTGFGSLGQTLRGVPDDRLVTKLVEMWIGVYGAILPFLQAVFLPLDLEFKGRGGITSAREAQEFWGVMPESLKRDEDRPISGGGSKQQPKLGEELDVRRITLITFRDTVILPRHENLMAIFSRLSLDSINASSPDPRGGADGSRGHAVSDPARSGAERPGTAGSLSPHLSSFNSQGSTLLDAASTSSGGGMSLAGRSRATSNTSAGSFGTSLPHLNSPTVYNQLGHIPGAFPTSTPHHPPPSMSPNPSALLADPAKVTETVARMLQCLYVIASCQTGDVGQGVVERLTGALKYNWLGRGRTGRDRRGWVGMRAGPTPVPGGISMGGRGALGSGLGVVGA